MAARDTITLRATGEPPSIRIGRNGASANFWLRLISEFSEAGTSTRSELVLSAERLIANRLVLKSLCEMYRVGVDPDERTTHLMRRANRERGELDGVLRDAPVLDEDQLQQRFQGSRFQRQLTAFQQRDLRKLLALPHGANFSVPGAGKTTATYAVYEAERNAGNVEQLLVIGPLSSFEAWEDESVACFDPVPVVCRYDSRIPTDAEVVLTTYQRLIGHYDTLATWAASRPTHIVLDEAHRMKKGRVGAWGAACLDLAQLARRRDILTGTPAPQSPADLEVLFDFVWPTQGHRLVPAEARRKDPPQELTRSIARKVQPLFARTRKAEMHLPPITHRPEVVPLTGLHRQIYDALRDQYAGEFAMGGNDRLEMTRLGQVLMYLLEAATNPALLVAGASAHDPVPFRHPPLDVPEGSTLYELLQDYYTYETPVKLLRLAELIRGNAEQSRKTLVWTNFVRNLTTLQRQLAVFQPALIHGGVPVTADGDGPSREAELAKFRGDDDCMVLLANPASIGEGVSLHRACHDAIYVDRTFNAGQYLQSVDRIHRLGLPPETETTIVTLITEDTVDEVVDDRVRNKAQVLGQLLDDPDVATFALPAEDDYDAPVDYDTADLQALLLHLSGGARE